VDAQSFCFVEVLVSEGKEKATVYGRKCNFESDNLGLSSHEPPSSESHKPSKKDSSAKETSSWWSMFSVETLKKAKRTKNAP